MNRQILNKQTDKQKWCALQVEGAGERLGRGSQSICREQSTPIIIKNYCGSPARVTSHSPKSDQTRPETGTPESAYPWISALHDRSAPVCHPTQDFGYY